MHNATSVTYPDAFNACLTRGFIMLHSFVEDAANQVQFQLVGQTGPRSAYLAVPAF